MGALRHDLATPARWPALDGVRGLAVICVVLYHAIRLLVLGEGRDASGAFSPAWWPLMTGRLALDAFFVLSGFLIVESWQSVRRRHGRLRDAVRDYGRRRAARILPGYYVSLLLLLPLVAPHLLRSPSDLALLAGVQQYLRPGLPSEVNVVYWSLTTEVHFYAVAPLVAVALRRVRPPVVIGLCLVMAAAWQEASPGGLPQSLVFGRVDQFVLGAALAPVVAACAEGRRPRVVELVQARYAGRALAVLLIVLGIWQGAILAGEATRPAALLHPLVGLVMAAMLLRLLTSETPSFLEAPWLRLTGIVSYGVYLFHYPLLEYGYRWAGMGPMSPKPAAVSLAVTAGIVAASFLLGGISYVVVERPFIRKKAVEPALDTADPRVAVEAWNRKAREEAGLTAGSLQRVW